MNPETEFEQSYARVLGDGIQLNDKAERFFRTFYDVFFSSSEEVRAMFKHTDMDRQVEILRKSFFHLISLHVTREPSQHLFDLAATHSQSGYNIRPAFYDLWLDALVETVRQLDPEYHADLELTWRMAFMPGVLIMQHYYDKPLPE